MDLIKKSIAASFAISLGVYVLLKIGTPLGAFLFALGLLIVCICGLNLYTGKCGYVIEQKSYKDLAIILLVNLISGYLLGRILSLCNDEIIVTNAIEKVATRDFSLAFFIKSIFCGIVMFVAVDLYKKGTKLGIIFGIPLFIFCGFQHCIANVITLGVAHTYDNSLWLAVIGNIIGSLLIRYLCKESKKTI